MSLNIFQKIKSVVWISAKRRCGSFDTLGGKQKSSHTLMMDTQPKSKNLFLSFFFFFLGMNGKETTWNQTNSTSRLVAELISKSAWVALVIFGFV
jgi:hypothetical protein